MKVWKIVLLVPAVIVLAVGVFVLSLYLVKVMWAWTVPDLFPGAVKQGLVAESISWLTSFKVVLLIAVFAGIARSTAGSKSEK